MTYPPMMTTAQTPELAMSIVMPCSGPWWSGPLHVSSIKKFRIIKADSKGQLNIWVTPGWYRRTTSPEGVISLIPMRRWRLWRHRLLWGFSGLVDAR